MDYLIPKGSIVIANILYVTAFFQVCVLYMMTRCMLTNEDTYPDPMTFDPERYLGPSAQPDPRKIVFGFGRRVCPGNSSQFICFWFLIHQTWNRCDVRGSLDIH